MRHPPQKAPFLRAEPLPGPGSANDKHRNNGGKRELAPSRRRARLGSAFANLREFGLERRSLGTASRTSLIPRSIPALFTAPLTENILGQPDSPGTNLTPVYLETVFQILREEEHGTPAASVAGVYFYLPQAIAVQASTFSL